MAIRRRDRHNGTPVTYTVDGAQYVTVMAGWGGSAGLMNTLAVGTAKPGWGRILTFALDAKAALKAPPFGHTGPPLPAITAKQDPQIVRTGALLFNSHCFTCHGLNAVAGPLPDLRYSTKETLDSFASIVLAGARVSDGMPSFGKILSGKDVAVKSVPESVRVAVESLDHLLKSKPGTVEGEKAN